MGIGGSRLPRMITRVHILEPDLDDGAGWVVRMTQWRKENEELMEKYAQVYTRPDKDKRKKYVYDIDFYDDSDKIFDLLFQDTFFMLVKNSTIKV